MMAIERLLQNESNINGFIVEIIISINDSTSQMTHTQMYVCLY